MTFKGDPRQQLGILRVTARAIQWLDAAQKVVLNVLVKDVKCGFHRKTKPISSAQRISPDTKEKLQLQLVPHVGEAQTFTFVNAKGRAAQLADRDAAKDVVQAVLSSHQQLPSLDAAAKKEKDGSPKKAKGSTEPPHAAKATTSGEPLDGKEKQRWTHS